MTDDGHTLAREFSAVTAIIRFIPRDSWSDGLVCDAERSIILKTPLVRSLL